METNTEQTKEKQVMFSIFKATGQTENPDSPPIRAILFDGSERSIEAINRLCGNYFNNNPVGEGNWVIENPKSGPNGRTFSVMPDLEFSQTYEAYDNPYILSGGADPASSTNKIL